MPLILAPNGQSARREMALVKARYAAGTNVSRTRSSVQGVAQNIYREITPQIRRTLVDQSRDLVDNSPFFHGLVERLVTYIVGCGIYPLAASSDKAWNTDADAVFAADVEDIDIRGGVDWSMLQQQLTRCEIVDGDSGSILTTDEEGAPKVWAVHGFDIGDWFGVLQSENYFDGIVLGEKGRRVAYKIRDETPNGVRSVVPVEARWFVHQINPARPGQVRGEPLLSSALTTGRDVHDILGLEKAAVKDASSKVDIITTGSGELDPETLLQEGGDTLNGSDGEEVARHYRELIGPESKVLRTGDTWTPYEPKRPGPAWQGFMDYLSQTVCLAARIPPSVLLQIKVGGADTRRDLAAAARVFEQEQRRIAKIHKKIRDFFIQVRIDDGTLKGAPEDWKKVNWQFPRSITVDAGREAQADREDVRAGLVSEMEYQGSYGSNWMRHRDQIESEADDKIVRAKRLAQKHGISFELAMKMLGDIVDMQPVPSSEPQKQDAQPFNQQ